MIIFLITGIILGLSAGLSPGPLMTLVISHSLKHGAREGCKVAIAPIVTDVPIVVVSVFLLGHLRDSGVALGLISIAGALVLVYLACQSLKEDAVRIQGTPEDARSLGKGALVNFTSPHPYLFWLTIGSPKVVEAWEQSPAAAAGFLVGFYVCLVGSKILLAMISGRSEQLLSSMAYRHVMRCLGGALFVLALLLFRDGLVFLGVLNP